MLIFTRSQLCNCNRAITPLGPYVDTSPLISLCSLHGTFFTRFCVATWPTVTKTHRRIDEK